MNSLTPIFKLSEDLLSRLFNLLAPPERFVAYDHSDVISVSQVCSLWREIALDLPSLWRSIELVPESIHWSNELLRRATKSPFINLCCARGLFDEILVRYPDIGLRIRNFGHHISNQAWLQFHEQVQKPGA